MNRRDVLTVAEAYAGRDDWGVENISLRTLAHLTAMLEAGISPADIVAHAGHTGRDCCPLFGLDREAIA